MRSRAIGETLASSVGEADKRVENRMGERWVWVDSVRRSWTEVQPGTLQASFESSRIIQLFATRTWWERTLAA